MKLTKARAAILIFTLLASTGSYALGRNGIDVGRAIVESRCSAGAFIAHAKAPSAVTADVHSDAAVAPLTTPGQTPGNLPAVPLAPANLIANGGIEALSGAKPTDWDSNTVGKNNGRFSVVPGYASRHALRVDITSYADGTADWFGPDLAAAPGAYYQFEDRYRSNVTTRAVLMLKDNTGKTQFINLASVPASDQWSGYVQRFFVPSNVSKIMISHPLDRVGWLETDAYSLHRATAPAFDEAMVSLTFDDGWRSIYDNALPLMSRYGVVSTQYLVSGFIGGYKEYLKPSQVYAFTKQGHEIASHTFDHADLTKVDDKQLKRQLKLSHDGLSKCYGSTADFAAPYGSNDQRTINAQKGFYQTSRSTEVGFNSPDTLDPYQLKVQNVRADTTPEQMRAWLETAKVNRVWLILVYHQVIKSGGEYSRTPADFEADLQSITASGISIKTIHDGYAATQKQAAAQ